MIVLAIDPGPMESAWLYYDTKGPRIAAFGKRPNEELLAMVKCDAENGARLVIEEVASFGMAVGREVFQTVRWGGRFEQAWLDGSWVLGGNPVTYLMRKKVAGYICNDARAKDANIRAALIDLFGGKDVAIGGLKCPVCHGKGVRGRERAQCDSCGGTGYKHPKGPLYGLKADCWSALAIAVTFAETV